MGQVMRIEDCVPKDKHDLAALELAEQAGFPALNPMVPDLLAWLQDANWPVAQKTANILSKAPPKTLVPHLRSVLLSNDADWKYWIIELLLTDACHEVISSLQSDLVNLAQAPSEEERQSEVQLAARAVLAKLPAQADD